MNLKNKIYYFLVGMFTLLGILVYFLTTSEKGQIATGLLFGMTFLVMFFKEELYEMLTNIGVKDGKPH